MASGGQRTLDRPAMVIDSSAKSFGFDASLFSPYGERLGDPIEREEPGVSSGKQEVVKSW